MVSGGMYRSEDSECLNDGGEDDQEGIDRQTFIEFFVTLYLGTREDKVYLTFAM